GTTNFYYDFWQVIEERDSATNLLRQYVYGVYIDEPLILNRNLDGDNIATGVDDQRLFYHQNTQHSVHALTDDNGNIAEGYQYDAYGRQIVYEPGANGVVDFGNDDVISPGGISAVSNPYMFTGRRLDNETNLYYYRNRYLNTTQGRFICRDPAGYWHDAYNYGNPMTYVGNTPSNALDPLGLGEFCGSEGTLSGLLAPDNPLWYPFESACKEHDRCYDTCGAKRLACDRAFLANLLSKCYLVDPVCSALAMAYFSAVFVEGAEAYSDAQNKACNKCKKAKLAAKKVITDSRQALIDAKDNARSSAWVTKVVEKRKKHARGMAALSTKFVEMLKDFRLDSPRFKRLERIRDAAYKKGIQNAFKKTEPELNKLNKKYNWIK
ncbi:MAG: RHS repeat-associated core domain-containing protein, partial [Candidatus Anammoxibacter sp.]